MMWWPDWSSVFLGIAQQVEMRDVATPLNLGATIPGNWQSAAYAGWMSARSGTSVKRCPDWTIFYHGGTVGQSGRGMPAAVMSGNHTIQFIWQER